MLPYIINKEIEADIQRFSTFLKRRMNVTTLGLALKNC